MRPDSIAFTVAGIVFGLFAGWIIGVQYGKTRQPPAAAAQTVPAPQSSTASVPVIDDAKVTAYKSAAERDPKAAEPRVELANLYFDAERYDEAAQWYSEALRLSPRDVYVSTRLGISYYSTNQPDKALEQFARSLALNPKHVETMLHIGVVKAFGKQDLDGAQQAWEQVIAVAPDSSEARTARRALENLRSAHPPASAEKPGG
jgi:tetratricopeptide (TPR) repeat protein